MRGMIDVTEADLRQLIQSAFDLSAPQGLGFMHHRAGGLPDDEADKIIGKERPDGRVAASMDYVHGRACKLTVFRENGRLWIRNRWFDHGDRALSALLERAGIPLERIDAARAEEAAADESDLEKALAFLRERGGSFTEPGVGEEGEAPIDVRSGFHVGSSRNLINIEWSGTNRTYSIRPSDE